LGCVKGGLGDRLPHRILVLIQLGMSYTRPEEYEQVFYGADEEAEKATNEMMRSILKIDDMLLT